MAMPRRPGPAGPGRRGRVAQLATGSGPPGRPPAAVFRLHSESGSGTLGGPFAVAGREPEGRARPARPARRAAPESKLRFRWQWQDPPRYLVRPRTGRSISDGRAARLPAGVLVGLKTGSELNWPSARNLATLDYVYILCFGVWLYLDRQLTRSLVVHSDYRGIGCV
jgi:hypothetical protein